MVKDVRTVALEESVTISWDHPWISPLEYRVNAVCWCSCSIEPYVHRVYTLFFTENELNISSLLPSIHCQVTLLAVYNPATLDSGLTFNVRTLPKGKDALHYNNYFFM